MVKFQSLDVDGQLEILFDWVMPGVNIHPWQCSSIDE